MSDNLINQTDAVALLRVNKSQVSNFLKKFPEFIVERRSSQVMVAKAECIKAYNRMTCRPAETAEGDVQDEESYTQARARRERANAQSAELDLAERLKSVISADAVYEAVYEAAMELRKALKARNRKLADMFSVKDDPNEILAALEEDDRRVLGALSTKLEKVVRSSSEEGNGAVQNAA